MAKYHGTYSCGHVGVINIFGPGKEREWKIERAFSGLCPECYQKYLEEQRKEENTRAMEESSEMGLPELLGTEKQIAWANTIRMKFINGLAQITKGDEAENLIKIEEFCYMEHTEAKFWIENRTESVKGFWKKVYKEWRLKEENRVPDDIMEELEKEAVKLTLKPETVTKNGIVKIKVKNNIVQIIYVKDDELISIVKKMKYRWDGTCWGKNITEFTGSGSNCAAAIGNKLLASGFSVQFPDEESKKQALLGNFTEECERKIEYGEKVFLISWEGQNDVLYQAARKLHGASWRNRAMRVSIEYYREVQDFAETLRFQFSAKAKKAIEEYSRLEAGIETEKVVGIEAETIDDKELLHKKLKSSGIIEELTDEA